MIATPRTTTSTARDCLRVAALGLTLAACGDGGSQDSQDSQGDSVMGAETPGIELSDDNAVFRTETFTLEPESESYLCYAVTVPEDLVIDGFDNPGAPFLHHILFSRTTAPDPEGLSECDVLFRYTWEPIFGAGAGASELTLPEGTGHRIDAGQQLVMQMHLLNAETDPVMGHVELTMHRSSASDPITIGNKTFGTFELSLPPGQESVVEAQCEIEEPVELLAVLPHMHQLGTSLTFEVGDSESSMEMVYERDPYVFDDQRVDLFERTLEPGDMTRLRCTYFNPHDDAVTFGESSTDEMCFMMGFTRGEHGLGSCTLREQDSGFTPTQCGDVEPSESGVGTACTASGNECPAGLRCTAGLSGGDDGVCIAIGCESSADCGGGDVTCCAPETAGGLINVCMPEACRPANCEPVD